jgi:hypothetical protein
VLPANFGETIVEPRQGVELRHDRDHSDRVAERAKHQKAGPERNEAARTDATKPHRLADNAPAHHKHKAPEAKLVYVY